MRATRMNSARYNNLPSNYRESAMRYFEAIDYLYIFQKNLLNVFGNSFVNRVKKGVL